MISFTCGACGQNLRVSDDKGGRKGRCPKCGTVLMIPSVSATAQMQPQSAASATTARDARSQGTRLDGLGAMAQGDSVAGAAARQLRCPLCHMLTPAGAKCALCGNRMASDGGGIECPSCHQMLPPNAKICVQCGVYAKTGRPIVVSSADDEDIDIMQTRAESIIGPLSWIFWSGLYPIYSEAGGKRKPYVTWAVLLMTILISCVFLVYGWTDSPKMNQMKDLMLWTGSQPEAEVLAQLYATTNFGDSRAFMAELGAIMEAAAAAEEGQAASGTEQPYDREVDTQSDGYSDGDGYGQVEPADPDEAEFREAFAGTMEMFRLHMTLMAASPEQIIEAHNKLPPEKRATGEFSPPQLVTHAFLHGGLIHLAGNMLFLLVLGTRVNSALGNIGMIVLYPVLAVAGGIAQVVAYSDGSIIPVIGASGAVMGLAGAYIVLFPWQQVHMVFWWRWGIIRLFHRSTKYFAVPGLLMVLAYISFDVLYTVLKVETGVAHWAHLGGFLTGVAVALILLCARLVRSGSDILSLTLGKHAYWLVGRPKA